MRLIRTLIVDDEPHARAGLAELLSLEEGFQLVGTCADGPSALKEIARLAPDLILLDVRMPHMDGFALLRALGPAKAPRVVFITAYDRYALKAFEVQAMDYLLKPFSNQRFQEVLARVKARLRVEDAAAWAQRVAGLLEGQDGPADPLAPFLVKIGRHRVVLPIHDVDWISAEGYLVRLHVGEQSYLHRESMSSLEERLDPGLFFRIHRSTIINLRRVREIRTSESANSVLLNSGVEIPMREGSVKALIARLRPSSKVRPRR